MIIEKPGRVAIRLDPTKHPECFEDGREVVWTTFQLGDCPGQVGSEGKELLILLDPGKENEKVLFRAELDLTKSHTIRLTWSPDDISLLFNKKLLQKMSPANF